MNVRLKPPLLRLAGLGLLALAFAVPPLANAQTITTIAGTGVGAFNSDGIAATSANVNTPYDVSLDQAGNIFIADYNNTRIRKITAATGIISTVAGTGVNAFGGDNGPATSARLTKPAGVFVDRFGNILISDTGNNRIRKVDLAGVITTIAGTGTGTFGGDGAAATLAQIASPNGVVADAAGNVYIADFANDRIRRVDAATGFISTIAGTATAGFSGDGGPASAASISGPTGIALDAQGNIYFSDLFNNRVRRISAAGMITTVAGTGSAVYNGDGIQATNASLAGPRGLALDGQGRLFIADATHDRIRMVNANGIITTYAGTGTRGFAGDGGPATAASFNFPSGVQVDASGVVYVTDQNNHRIRRISSAGVAQSQIPEGLFSSTNDVVNFRSVGGGNVPWTLTTSNSIIVVPGTGNVQSTQTYGDFILHAEFLLPATGNGNCGLFLQGRYEVQIFNSFGAVTLNANDCGSIFGQSPPSTNACLAPGVWQTYDIIFHQPRWNGNTKLSNARATVVLNGVTVQDNVQITGSTSAATGPEGPTPGPLILQDNGFAVELRNIQILPLSATASLINGSFEMSPITTNIVLTNGFTLVSGWSVGTTGPLSFVTGPSFGVSPLDGNQMLEFNSGNTLAGDTISQTFPTTPGQSYTVSFNVARTPANVAGTVSLRGTVTSSTGQTLATLNGLAPSSGWSAAQTFSFAATTPTSTLTFLDTSLATVAVDALLDNVSVTTTAANPTNTIVYDLIARMDGSQDTLIFRDGTLQWNHIANGAGAPGRSLGLNVPTTISSSLNGAPVMNMVDWIPTWPLPVPDNIRFDAVSSVFTNLTPVLPSGGILSVSVTNVSARGSLSVVQLPSATNGQTLIVNYADGQVGSGYVTGRVTVVSLAVPPGPPGIAQAPGNLRAVPGTNVTFSVGVSGPGPFTYLWRQNGINIPGATGPTLTLTNVQAVHNGAYTVLIGNTYGSVTGTGSLEVLTAPAITMQPLGTTNLAGDSVSFSVEATGSTPLTYQWRRDGVPLPGAVASTLVLDAVSVTSAGLYSVIVSNAAGVAVSSNAMLAVSSAPVIITPPAARIVNATAPVSFTVAALGDAPFTYQWRFNGTNLAGATGATFSIGAATPSHEGLYSVVVGNALGSATSSAARLTVLPVSVVVPWAAGSGGPGSDVGHAIAVDAAGNSYVAGHFTGTATFGTNTLVSAGNTDIFITKQNSNGQLLWVRRAGGPGYDVARGIAVDAAGNCHVTGAYEGEAAFGTTTLTNTSPTSYADAFVAKFDTAGTLVWARTAGVEFTNDEGTAVAVDSAGNVLITGRSVLDTFAGGPVANTGRIFVAKYDSAGAEVWARKAGSYSGGNLDTGTGIATDSAGNVFVGGVFYSPVAAFGAGSFANLGNADAFLAKFDAAGTLQWARQAGGTGEDTASGVAVAADGSAYLVGALGGNANFSGSNVTSLAGAASDGFVAKFAPGGTVTWVRQMGGSGLSAARAVAVDAAGTVHVTGYFSGGAAFGTNSLGGISGSYDAFLTRLDPSGVFAFAQQAGGADLSGDFGLGVGADAAGNSFITGYFSGTSSIGGGSLPSRGGEDVLVTRFNQFTGGGQPQLGLLRNGPQFRMRWPLASSSYVLQSTTNLLAPVWRDETNALTLNGTELETDVTPGGAVKFYRLRKP